jgi:hypothetical protein
MSMNMHGHIINIYEKFVIICDYSCSVADIIEYT